VRTVLLTNRTTAKERARLTADLAGGDVDIVVGTHALLTDDVAFASARSGRHRRATPLRSRTARGATRQAGATGEEGADPDLLVMTATPIPRTGGDVVFGDLI